MSDSDNDVEKLNPITIEKIRHDEIKQIIRISEECGLAMWSKSDYEIEIGRNESFIVGAKDKNDLIGFIVVRITSPNIPDKTLSSESESEADILNIGVKKTHQKKGIGRILLSSFMIEAQSMGIKSVWLEVRKSNYNARQFYLRRGFIEIQERKNFYTNPLENAVVMKLQLTKPDKNLKNKT